LALAHGCGDLQKLNSIIAFNGLSILRASNCEIIADIIDIESDIESDVESY
jgi:hypothetical protein